MYRRRTPSWHGFSPSDSLPHGAPRQCAPGCLPAVIGTWCWDLYSNRGMERGGCSTVCLDEKERADEVRRGGRNGRGYAPCEWEKVERRTGQGEVGRKDSWEPQRRAEARRRPADEQQGDADESWAGDGEMAGRKRATRLVRWRQAVGSVDALGPRRGPPHSQCRGPLRPRRHHREPGLGGPAPALPGSDTQRRRTLLESVQPWLAQSRIPLRPSDLPAQRFCGTPGGPSIVPRCWCRTRSVLISLSSLLRRSQHLGAQRSSTHPQVRIPVRYAARHDSHSVGYAYRMAPVRTSVSERDPRTLAQRTPRSVRSTDDSPLRASSELSYACTPRRRLLRQLRRFRYASCASGSYTADLEPIVSLLPLQLAF